MQTQQKHVHIVYIVHTPFRCTDHTGHTYYTEFTRVDHTGPADYTDPADR